MPCHCLPEMGTNPCNSWSGLRPLIFQGSTMEEEGEQQAKSHRIYSPCRWELNRMRIWDTSHLPLRGLEANLQQYEPIEKQSHEKQGTVLGHKGPPKPFTSSGPQSSGMPLTSCVTSDKYSTSMCLSAVICEMGIIVVPTLWGYYLY